VLDVRSALEIGVQVVTLLAALTAGYVGLRRWVQRAAADTRAVAEQIQTNGASTIGTVIEHAAADVTEVRRQVEILTERSNTNRDLAMSALTLARSAHERLDAHLAGHKEG
jgi:hypothetical protein